jgi:hypothetical protein
VSRLRVHNLIVSLDGFATGEGQSLDAAFGHAQQAFMEWFGKLRIFRGTQPEGQLGPDEACSWPHSPRAIGVTLTRSRLIQSRGSGGCSPGGGSGPGPADQVLSIGSVVAHQRAART